MTKHRRLHPDRFSRDDMRASPGEHDRPHETRPHAAVVSAVNDFGTIGANLARLEQARVPQTVSMPAPAESRVLARRPDDLKRIRGIGVLFEKKLNALGYSTYAELAAWTPEIVRKVEDKLEFSGRIERESWVDQARILARGESTEFSQRIDRSETTPSSAAAAAAACAAVVAASATRAGSTKK